MIRTLISPISAASGHTVRALGTTIDSGKKTVNGIKHSVKDLKASISSNINNILTTNNAVAEGSQDIAKLIGGLSYKVRMLPASVGPNTLLSKRGDAIYISESLFSSPQFQEQLESSVKDQGLSIDTKKLRVSMDYFGRLQFSYLGKFNNIGLDQFGDGTPTHTALTNAIKSLIDYENKKICTQIMLGHILKDNISKNNQYIRGTYEGKSYSFSLEQATNSIINDGKNEQFYALINILEEQGSSLSEIQEIKNQENISPKEIISRYPNGRKVMDKGLYLRQNSSYSFDSIQNNLDKVNTDNIGEENNDTITDEQNIPSQNNSKEENNKSSEINIFEQVINTMDSKEKKILYINNLLKNAPDLSNSNIILYMKLIQIKTDLESEQINNNQNTIPQVLNAA